MGSLKKNPKPILFSIFFSNAQKNLNWQNSKPITTNRTWYKGNMINKRMGVCQKPKSSLKIPNQLQTGLEIHAEADPVMAKTIKIMVS